METEDYSLDEERFIAVLLYCTALASCKLTSQTDGISSRLPFTLSLVHLLDIAVSSLCRWQWLRCQRVKVA